MYADSLISTTRSLNIVALNEALIAINQRRVSQILYIRNKMEHALHPLEKLNDTFTK